MTFGAIGAMIETDMKALIQALVIAAGLSCGEECRVRCPRQVDTMTVLAHAGGSGKAATADAQAVERARDATLRFLHERDGGEMTGLMVEIHALLPPGRP